MTKGEMIGASPHTELQDTREHWEHLFKKLKKKVRKMDRDIDHIFERNAALEERVDRIENPKHTEVVGFERTPDDEVVDEP